MNLAHFIIYIEERELNVTTQWISRIKLVHALS